LNFGITAGTDALILTYESNGAQDMATAVKIGGGDSLTEVRDYINSSSLDITASIVKKSDTNYALAIKSREGLGLRYEYCGDRNPRVFGA
jgi:flagellar capping protein FliD